MMWKRRKNSKLYYKKKNDDDYKGKYPYYVDHIIEEAMKKYDLTENEILSGGLHIFTELNPTIQNATEQVYQNDKLFRKVIGPIDSKWGYFYQP